MTDPQGATPAATRHETPAEAATGQTPVLTGVPFLAPTPRFTRAVTPPDDRRITPPFVPGARPFPPPQRDERTESGAGEGVRGAAADAAGVLPPEPAAIAVAHEPVAPGTPVVAPLQAAPSAPDDDQDAWDWGHGEEIPVEKAGNPATLLGLQDAARGSAAGSGAFLESVATSVEQGAPGARGDAVPPLETAEVAARVLESLAGRLRARSLVLDASAPVDSEAAVLASVLATLFTHRGR